MGCSASTPRRAEVWLECLPSKQYRIVYTVYQHRRICGRWTRHEVHREEECIYKSEIGKWKSWYMRLNSIAGLIDRHNTMDGIDEIINTPEKNLAR